MVKKKDSVDHITKRKASLTDSIRKKESTSRIEDKGKGLANREQDHEMGCDQENKPQNLVGRRS